MKDPFRICFLRIFFVVDNELTKWPIMVENISKNVSKVNSFSNEFATLTQTS